MKLFLASIFVFYSMYANSQDLQILIPPGSKVIEYADFNERSVSQCIRQLKDSNSVCKRKDFEKVKSEMEKINALVKTNELNIKDGISKLRKFRTDILNLADVTVLKKQIKEKELNIEKIKKEFNRELNDIGYKGLYMILIKDISSYAEKKDLIYVANSILTPRAIEDINGVFIKSYSKIENSTIITDNINSRISGELIINTELPETKVYRDSKLFIYLAKVEVINRSII